MEVVRLVASYTMVWSMIYAIKTHEVIVLCGGTKLTVFYSKADYSTTAGRIPILFSWRLLGSTPATHQYRAHSYAVNIDEVEIPG